MTATDQVSARSPRVFISYAHDSSEHKQSVLTFGKLLREQLGIDAHLDEWYVDERRDWSEWALQQLESADFVLAIASPKFRERTDGQGDPAEGRGSRHEGALMRDKMTEDRATWLRKILPVVLPGQSLTGIPQFLLPYSATHYFVHRLTPDGILELRRVLVRRPRHPLPPLGAPPPLAADDPNGPAPHFFSPPTTGNRVTVSRSKARDIVGGDVHHHGERNPR